jgi:hypothetical protein
MPTSIEIKSLTDSDLHPIQILLAESDPVEIDRLVANIDREFQAGITIVKDYSELLASITRSRPQLVLLGKIDKTSYSEIAQDCHAIRRNLAIVLLSSQGLIIDSFRQLVRTCGLADVITRDASNLNQLLESVTKSYRQQLANQPLGKPTARPNRQHLTTEPLGKSAHQFTLDRDDPPAQPTRSGQNILAALDEIVAVSNNYFGPLAQGNYWRKAHARVIDEFPSLQNWSADHFSKLSCNENILAQELTLEDVQSLRVWVRFFIEECERIIIDYRSILNTADISPLAKDMFATSQPPPPN